MSFEIKKGSFSKPNDSKGRKPKKLPAPEPDRPKLPVPRYVPLPDEDKDEDVENECEF